MKKAKPEQMRRALVAVGGLKKAGVLFIPMPVLNEKDSSDLAKEAIRRLSVIFNQAE